MRWHFLWGMDKLLSLPCTWSSIQSPVFFWKSTEMATPAARRLGTRVESQQQGLLNLPITTIITKNRPNQKHHAFFPHPVPCMPAFRGSDFICAIRRAAKQEFQSHP